MSFTTGSCPFGVFDADSQFAIDADRLVTWVARRLGESSVQVELSSSDVYTCFEEATLEYSAIVNSYQAKSSLASWLGSPTGSLTGGQNRYPNFSLEMQRRQAQAFSDEAGSGGNRTLYTGSISLTAGLQDYDLQTLLNPTGSDGLARRMIVREVFHFSPLAAYRMFGQTSALNYLNTQFNFSSYTPETVFHLLPIWEDVLRQQQFKMSNKVRRSNYSYELHDNVLRLYPTPTQSNALFFTYQFVDEGTAVSSLTGSADATSFGVANMSNIPFGNIQYSSLNSLSKQWIWKMTLALCKETLGLIRRKMSSIPIPDGDVQLDGGELVQDGKSEMEQLRSDLKALLEETTYEKLAMKETEQAESLYQTLSRIPMKIFVG